jgi:hypothetical protein
MLEVATVIRDQIGTRALMCFGSTNFKGGESDEKTHDGFLEFTATNNPKISENVQVRVELAFDDTYTVKVYNTVKEFAHYDDVYCDQLSELLFDILG